MYYEIISVVTCLLGLAVGVVFLDCVSCDRRYENGHKDGYVLHEDTAYLNAVKCVEYGDKHGKDRDYYYSKGYIEGFNERTL